MTARGSRGGARGRRVRREATTPAASARSARLASESSNAPQDALRLRTARFVHVKHDSAAWSTSISSSEFLCDHSARIRPDANAVPTSRYWHSGERPGLPTSHRGCGASRLLARAAPRALTGAPPRASMPCRTKAQRVTSARCGRRVLARLDERRGGGRLASAPFIRQREAPRAPSHARDYSHCRAICVGSAHRPKIPRTSAVAARREARAGAPRSSAPA